VDGVGRTSPRRDDQAGDAELLPSTHVVGARDGAAETDLERRGFAVVLSSHLPEPLDLARRRLERVAHADPTVADPRRPLQRGRALPADQDRRPRLLDRLGLASRPPRPAELPPRRPPPLGPPPLA